MTVRLGIDVGATSIRARRFPGGASERIEVATDARGGDALTERIAEVVARANADRLVTAVGVGVPGQVDPAAGTVRHAVNLGIDGHPFPLAERVGAEVGVPVVLENDVRTAALGAHHLLAATWPDLRSLVYLSLGTGVAAGVIIDGRLHRGSRGIAGEIGHAPLGNVSASCHCGSRGCLEAVAGGRYLNELVEGGAPAAFGPPLHPAGEAAATAIARALYVLATAYDPDIFVLGGGIAPDATPAVRQALAALSTASPFGEVVLTNDRVLTLPPDADPGTRGAALLTPPPAPAGTDKGGNRP